MGITEHGAHPLRTCSNCIHRPPPQPPLTQPSCVPLQECSLGDGKQPQVGQEPTLASGGA